MSIYLCRKDNGFQLSSHSILLQVQPRPRNISPSSTISANVAFHTAPKQYDEVPLSTNSTTDSLSTGGYDGRWSQPLPSTRHTANASGCSYPVFLPHCMCQLSGFEMDIQSIMFALSDVLPGRESHRMKSFSGKCKIVVLFICGNL